MIRRLFDARRSGGLDRRDRERGAALVEFALLLPLLASIFMGMSDYGIAYNTARETSNGIRAAARAGAAASNARIADYAILRTVQAAMANSEGSVTRVIVYKSTASDGAIPSACLTASVSGLCNRYTGGTLSALSPTSFDGANCVGDLDVAWCPTSRTTTAAGSYLGVAVTVSRNSMLGGTLGVDQFTRRAVFRLEVSPT